MCCNEKRRGVHDNNRGAGARSANAVRDKVKVRRIVRRRRAAGGHTVGAKGLSRAARRASPSTNTSRVRSETPARKSRSMRCAPRACAVLLLCVPTLARRDAPPHATHSSTASDTHAGMDATDDVALITGVAGYIGSHMALELLERGRHVVGIDNMVRGSQNALDVLSEFSTFTFIRMDLSGDIERIFQRHSIKTVFHFAAMASVAESFKMPMMYHRNITRCTQPVSYTHLTLPTICSV